MKTEKKPLIFAIKRNSLDDGPGIRTTLFFKGCPLHCIWCHNPEGISPERQMNIREEFCIHCGICQMVCANNQEHYIRDGIYRIMNCSCCSNCVRSCPRGARSFIGTYMNIEELMKIVLIDRVFYKNSGGGVTFSGGEPALYSKFAGQLAGELASVKIHVLLETSGFFDWQNFSKYLLPYLNKIYFDIKLMDPDLHYRYTGQGNELIHRNFKNLLEYPGLVLPRIPLIPEITDKKENITAIYHFLKDCGLNEVGLLPYNPLWSGKDITINRQGFNHDRFIETNKFNKYRDYFLNKGFKVF